MQYWIIQILDATTTESRVWEDVWIGIEVDVDALNAANQHFNDYCISITSWNYNHIICASLLLSCVNPLDAKSFFTKLL